MSNYGPTPLVKALLDYFKAKSPEIIVEMAVPCLAEEAPKVVCDPSNIMCRLSEAKDSLVPYIEQSGLSKENSSYVASAVIGAIGLRYLYNRFSASNPYDLIKNIINAEFGKNSPIAMEIFNAFEKSIQDAIDAQLKELEDKYKTLNKDLSVKEKTDFIQSNQQIALDKAKAQMEHGLKANKPQLLANAQAVINAPENVAAPVAAGAQAAIGPQMSAKAQARNELQEMVQRAFFVSPQLSTQAKAMVKTK